MKTEFTPTKALRWNIDDPAAGVVAVGLALWGPEPDFFYRIGGRLFLRNFEMKKLSVLTVGNSKLSKEFSRKLPPGVTLVLRLSGFCASVSAVNMSRSCAHSRRRFQSLC